MESIKQLKALLSNESDLISKMANTSAFINEHLDDINWVGFYRVVGDELKLAPFQGKIACFSIAKGKGVCGTAWARKMRYVVDDVHSFAGHIACDSASRSEVVIPLFDSQGEVIAVLDVDSPKPARFDEQAVNFLQSCADVFMQEL